MLGDVDGGRPDVTKTMTMILKNILKNRGPAAAAIWKVLLLPHRSQDRLLRDGAIDADLYALAKHYRWRGVCSGGGRVRGTNIVGFSAWRAAFIPMFKRVESRTESRRV